MERGWECPAAANQITMTSNLRTAVSIASQRLQPPVTVIAFEESRSFDNAFVELRDGTVAWRIVRERSWLRLVAAPDFDRSVWYDVDLLERMVGYRGAAVGEQEIGAFVAPDERMRPSIEQLIEDLERLRPAVAHAFGESTWATTRKKLGDLGRKRDLELFGRPAPRDEG